jgi:hypothetical protein
LTLDPNRWTDIVFYVSTRANRNGFTNNVSALEEVIILVAAVAATVVLVVAIVVMARTHGPGGRDG